MVETKLTITIYHHLWSLHTGYLWRSQEHTQPIDLMKGWTYVVLEHPVPLLPTWIKLIPAWRNKCIHYNTWDEGMEMDVNIIPQFTGHVRDYLSVQV